MGNKVEIQFTVKEKVEKLLEEKNATVGEIMLDLMVFIYKRAYTDGYSEGYDSGYDEGYDEAEGGQP